MITSRQKERWEIRKCRNESSLFIELDSREFSIFRTILKKYKKDLDITFTTRKKYFDLKPRKQQYLKLKFEEDGNKITFLKYLWNNVREKGKFKCSRCERKTKYLYMLCKNLTHIKEFRAPDFDLYCTKCWEMKNKA